MDDGSPGFRIPANLFEQMRFSRSTGADQRRGALAVLDQVLEFQKCFTMQRAGIKRFGPTILIEGSPFKFPISFVHGFTAE